MLFFIPLFPASLIAHHWPCPPPNLIRRGWPYSRHIQLLVHVCVCVHSAPMCMCVCVCMCPCLVACTYNAYARSSTRRDCKMTTGTKGLWNLGSRKVMRLGSWRRCWKMERRLNGLLHFCSHIPPMITGLPGIYLLEVPPVKFTFLDIKKGGLNEDMDILACLLDSFDREETS